MERRGVSLRGGPLRLCIAGGAAVPVELQDRWAEATGVELRQGYGLTEAAPVCLFNRFDAPNVRGSLGVAMPGVDVAIFPPADYENAGGALAPAEPLPDDTVGEICVRGDNVSPGYVRGATGLPYRGEWLCTGDEGVRDATGHVRFLGLLKPMFTRNGFNIYPREIERVIGEMPGVLHVVAEPVPEPIKENDIRIRLVGDVTEEDVRTWCELRLSAYKQPSVIEIVSS
jgi:long-chain acyl-CoA synthetase